MRHRTQSKREISKCKISKKKKRKKKEHRKYITYFLPYNGKNNGKIILILI